MPVLQNRLDVPLEVADIDQVTGNVGQWPSLVAGNEVEDFGGRTGTKPIPVGLVVATEFKAGARWRPRELSEGKAVLALLSNTVSARRQPEKSLATLQKVVAEAKTLKGLRGEASALALSMLARLERIS